jgi:hypothetical protein
MQTLKGISVSLCFWWSQVGNGAALIILAREKKNPGWGRNTSKHQLMLRCLAWNDLAALLGMLVLMHAQLHLPPQLTATQGYCAARLFVRIFGLGSGVVALVMAAERWLALSHPFVYQQVGAFCPFPAFAPLLMTPICYCIIFKSPYW